MSNLAEQLDNIEAFGRRPANEHPLTELEQPCPTCGGPLIHIPTKGYARCLILDCPDTNAYIMAGRALVAVCPGCKRPLGSCSCEGR